MTTTSWTVKGLTCNHCVSSVTEEVSDVPGVEQVTVDLKTGLLTVTSQQPLDDAAIRAAVEEAGYRVA